MLRTVTNVLSVDPCNVWVQTTANSTDTEHNFSLQCENYAIYNRCKLCNWSATHCSSCCLIRNVQPCRFSRLHILSFFTFRSLLVKGMLRQFLLVFLLLIGELRQYIFSVPMARHVHLLLLLLHEAWLVSQPWAVTQVGVVRHLKKT